MPHVTAHVSISLDGYLAGPDQTEDDPLGKGAEALHRWMFESDDDGDARSKEDLLRPRGAFVMGRNMFGPVRGEWTGDWRGWWGDEPPYAAPVFVLTNHPRESVEMDGGTTFHFVTDGFDSAFRQATEAAGDLDVSIAGGASTLRQALNAGIVDELTLDITPILLGAGERLLDGVTGVRFKPVDVVPSPYTTHVTYRVTSG